MTETGNQNYLRIVFYSAVLGLALSTGAALACVVPAQMDFRDIFLADLVIVGEILTYEIVDPSSDQGPLFDYARFEVRVWEVLLSPPAKTQAPATRTNPDRRHIWQRNRITVTWDNSTFGEPEALGGNDKGSFLIALRHPTSALPPLRAGSAFIAPTPEPELYTVLQAPCAGAFIFEMDSLIAIALRQLITTDRDKEAEWEVLSEFLFKNGAVGMVERKLIHERDSAP